MSIERPEYSEIGFFPGECVGNNIISFLEKHCELIPQRTALRWVPAHAMAAWDGKGPLPHESVDYRTLLSRITAVAAGLKKLGIGKGDRVIIFVPMSVELYITMFAVQRIGASAVFLDSWARKDHLGVCAKTVDPKAMISFVMAFDLCRNVPELDAIPGKVVTGRERMGFSASLDELLAEKSTAAVEPVRGDTTALITFTTGSSGVPKGANRTHRFLSAQHRALDKTIPYTPTDVDLPIFPVFSLNNLGAGVETVLPAIDLARPSERDASILVNQISATGATCCTLSPHLFNKVAEHCAGRGTTLSNVRRAVTGGAPVSRDNVRDFMKAAPGADVLVLYGSTEVEPIAHIRGEDMMKDEGRQEGVNVGRICDELEFKLIRIQRGPVDAAKRPLEQWEAPTGEPGELIVCGDHVCEGYYNNPEADRAVKVRDSRGRLWHRTGDVGRIDGLGQLWLVGRVHNTIMRAGKALFPVQAEIVLKRLPFVRQAAFLGVDDPVLGQSARAVVSLKEEHLSEDRKALSAEVARALRRENIPVDQVHIVEAVPMDPRHHSKVEYDKLRAQLPSSPCLCPGFFARWRTFIRERFPLGKHLPLAVFYFLANAAVALRLHEGEAELSWRVWMAGAVVALIFFHLRVFDEIKDFTHDKDVYPTRPLARGLISPGEARAVAFGILAAEIAASVLLSWSAVAAMAGVAGYSLIMYKEFFVSAWLRPRLATYALVHTLVSSLMALFVYCAVTGAAPGDVPSSFLIFMLANWMVFNVFEFGRKTFGRDEEIERADSYSRRFGPSGAAFAVIAMAGCATGIAIGLGEMVSAGAGYGTAHAGLFGALFVSSVYYVLAPQRRGGMVFRAACSAYILLFNVIIAMGLLISR